jgi:hypothetical protein
MFSSFLTTFIFLFAGQFSFADSEVVTLKTYGEVAKVLKTETNNFLPSELLVVFDLDRTVLHSIDCLSETDDTKGFFRFEKTVQLCGASLTSPLLPKIISELQNKNYGVMALTARRAKGFDQMSAKGEKPLEYPMLEGTLRQLEERLTVSEADESAVVITFPTAPDFSSKIKTIDFDQQGKKKVLKKSLVIKNGVAMASGANKGLALQAFTGSLENKNTIQQIIFVDDDINNIRHLEKAYDKSNASILIIHYTEFDKRNEIKNKTKN